MKKIFNYAIAAIAVIAAASCTKEFSTVEQSKSDEKLVSVTFGAQLEDSKAYLDGKAVVWETTDSIAVWDGTAKRTFKVQSCEGSTATFTGEIAEEANDFHIVYPYTSFVSVKGDSLTISIPATQVVGANSSAKDVLVSTAHVTALKTVQLKNAVSLVKFSFENAGATSVVLFGAADEIFVGQAYTKDGGETVSCTAKGTAKLTVTPEEGSFAAGTYYAAIAPCSFATGLTAIYGNASEKGKISTANAVNFVRNAGINLKALDNNAKTVKTSNTLKTADDLLAFGEMMPYYVAGETVTMANDISLSGKSWTPGTFYGTFDGNGHSITNIQIETTGHACFISYLYGIVKNVTFGAPSDGSLFKSTADKKATICCAPIGWVYDGGQISDIVNYAAIEAAGIYPYYVAGVCGRYNSSKPVSNCKNYGTVTSKVITAASTAINVSGVIAQIGAVTTFENCENYAAVNFSPETTGSTANVGGVVGYSNLAATFKNFKNSGSVAITETLTSPGGLIRIGGILGTNQGSGTIFEGCENTGDVTCNAAGFNTKALYMGGIVGQNESKATVGIKMTNCTNSGNLTNNAASKAGLTAIGGIIGYRNRSSASGIGTITGCTNLGALSDLSCKGSTGSTYIGGIVGFNQMGITITDCNNGMDGEEFGAITKTTTGTSAQFTSIGGIIGWQEGQTDYKTQPVNLKNCHNYATISNPGDTQASYVYLAGIIAGNEPYKYTSGSSTKYALYTCNIENCINDGDIKNYGNGKSQIRMGGFIGDCANNITMTSCTNNAEVSSEVAVTTAANFRLGGIFGSISRGTPSLEEVANYGNITGDLKTSTCTLAEMGGLIGYGNRSDMKMNKCKFNATVSLTGTATTQYLKALVGNLANIATITECGVAGNLGGTALTEDNFMDNLYYTTSTPTVTDCYLIK